MLRPGTKIFMWASRNAIFLFKRLVGQISTSLEAWDIQNNIAHSSRIFQQAFLLQRLNHEETNSKVWKASLSALYINWFLKWSTCDMNLVFWHIYHLLYSFHLNYFDLFAFYWLHIFTILNKRAKTLPYGFHFLIFYLLWPQFDLTWAECKWNNEKDGLMLSG